jgi:hypothetical protein
MSERHYGNCRDAYWLSIIVVLLQLGQNKDGGGVFYG